MKNRLFTGWDLKRWLYLAIGVFIMGNSAMHQEWWPMLAGAYFVVMAVFKLGCASGSCAFTPPNVPPSKV